MRDAVAPRSIQTKTLQGLHRAAIPTLCNRLSGENALICLPLALTERDPALSPRQCMRAYAAHGAKKLGDVTPISLPDCSATS